MDSILDDLAAGKYDEEEGEGTAPGDITHRKSPAPKGNNAAAPTPAHHMAIATTDEQSPATVADVDMAVDGNGGGADADAAGAGAGAGA
eukprot:CAMPEP_0182586596 /NCGR_PEP_ID=MMETSP1324-20130603/63020_1 /TAXON_ID=236786 /ORGANISM="Florenciella sp., Strain RCC1587" /LENGTH=88 /DNA_ID=CAMNT_0024803511 /DNA_START=87 /DNA_END=349 /DNA_ORIENTATION=+